jgi:hypothetical protein
LDVLKREPRAGSVEERVVRPERLEDRPPAKAGGARLAVDVKSLRPGDGSVARGDQRWPETRAAEDDRIAQGYDASDPFGFRLPPTQAEIDASVATTISGAPACWRRSWTGRS